MQFIKKAFATSRMNLMIVFCTVAFPVNAISQVALPSSRSSSATRVSQKTQVAVQKDFTGTWKLKETATETSQRIKAIEDATSALNRFVQGRARDKMKKMTSPPTQVKIVDAGNQVKLASGGREFVVRIDGPPVAIKLDSGNATMQAGKRADTLIVVIKTNNLKRTVVYELSADGKSLRQQTVIETKKLATPIRFTNRFVR